MLVLLFISFDIFTTVVTGKSELYQIGWFHSDTVNIESILCEARYSQKNLSKQILMIKTISSQYWLVWAFKKKAPLEMLCWQLPRTSSLSSNMLLYSRVKGHANLGFFNPKLQPRTSQPQTFQSWTPQPQTPMGLKSSWWKGLRSPGVEMSCYLLSGHFHPGFLNPR